MPEPAELPADTAGAEPSLSGSSVFRIAVVVIAVVVGIAGLRAAGTILLPILISGFLVIVAQPVVGGLIRSGVPRGVAVLTLSLIHI